MLASVLSFSEGRVLKSPLTESTFIPDYLGERTRTTEPSIEQQAAEFRAFAGKLKAVQGK